MRILMAMHSLAMGGAEKFFTNLAQALNERHEVICYIPAIRCGDPTMIDRLGEVPVSSISWFTPLLYRAFYKLTLVLQRRWPAFDPEATLHSRNLRALHQRHRFQVVNAQLMPAARQVCTAYERLSLPITKSDHGDTAHAGKSDEIIFKRLDALICPAAANAAKARALPLRSDCRIVTIPYGHRGPRNGRSRLPAFEGITFGMVARGVRDKGWAEAIEAARLVRTRSAMPFRLVLVGAGAFLDDLRSKLPAADHEWIHFTGQQSEPEQWISGFDVGLLPTCLPEESLPNSIIEYLACGKPVITTAVGGIPEMIEQAGRLVPLDVHGRAHVEALAEAMLVLLEDPSARAAMSAHAATAFRAYSMESCVVAYERLFEEMCMPA